MNSSEIDIIDLSNEQHLFQYDELKEFLGIAIRDAERSHTGKSLWDLALKSFSEAERANVLAETCLNDPKSHFHVSRMFVARDTATNKPVASVCGHFFPEFRLGKTLDCISQVILEKFPTKFNSIEEVKLLWEAASFLKKSFPAEVDFCDSWMIDVVYTLPEYRGQGLASRLLGEVIQKGKLLEHKWSMITCAVGNDKALNVYKKCGFRLLGTGDSVDCMSSVGFPGFYVLGKDL
jgi:GNAT superfamily N-acetyltransferase